MSPLPPKIPKLPKRRSGRAPARTQAPQTSESPEGQDVESRQTCYRCFRPTSHCYCEQIQKVKNQTEVIILQHPRERFHAIGTARIAELALEDVHLVVNTDRKFDGATELEALGIPDDAGVLYPCAEAKDLASLPPAERPRTLVVLDGTWHHARTLFRDIPALHKLPRYMFTPEQPSEYRIRREPHRDFVSTVEAIVIALKALEPDTPGLSSLLSTFRHMIDRQATWPKATRPRVLKRRRPDHLTRMPRAFVEDFPRVVLVYGEAYSKLHSKAPREAASASGKKILVQWTAKRLSSGECFESFPSAPQEVPDVLRRHMGLLDNDDPPEKDFVARWHAFLRDDDILVAWNQSVVTLLESISPWTGNAAFLKSAYHALYNAAGPLEDIIAAEKLTTASNPFTGRASTRLGNAEALARFIHARAHQRM